MMLDTTSSVLRYRDGCVVLMNALRVGEEDLRRAGFRAYWIRFKHDDGSRFAGELWSQDLPTLADYLNAAQLLFDTQPGSLSWAPCEARDIEASNL